MVQPSERILCVDDQPEITDLIHRQLRDSYDCHFAASGAQALSALDTAGPFAVVVADYSMPHMDGITLLGELGKRSPDTIPIMLTAYGDIDVAIAALHKGNIFRFLRKPWESCDLKRAIDDALDHYHRIANERRLRRELAAANAELDARLAELDETNRLLEYWVEFSPAVLYSLAIDDGKARPSYVSKNFSRLTGHERTALVVEPDFWGTHIHPDDRVRYETTLARLLDGEVAEQTLEYRFLHAGGEPRRVLDAMRVIRNHAGEPLELVGAWMDTSTQSE
jgi:CheY-like chemotaxis protein